MEQRETLRQSVGWRGQGMAEYALLIVLMGLASLVVVAILGNVFTNQFEDAIFCADRATSSDSDACGGGYDLPVASGPGNTNPNSNNGGGSATQPLAEFTFTCTGTTCTFDGSLSAEGDSAIVSYSWNFGDSNSGSGQNPVHTYASAGTYNVTLTVTDSEGDTDTSPEIVTILPPDPVAAFTPNCTDLTCTFDASASSDDVAIASYSWTYGDGTGTGTGENPSYTYGSAGTYTVMLIVTDADGRSDSLSQSVTVTAPNNPPVASFIENCSGDTCTFDASASSDVDSDTPFTFSWNYGDFNTEVLNVTGASHTYTVSGTYTVILTVIDARGASDQTAKTVTVTAATANTPPTADATITCVELDCTLDASASSDSDGTISTWNWNFGDGNTGTGENISYSYSVDGTYNIVLTVTDNQGDTATYNETVTVAAASSNTAPTASFTRSCVDLACSFDGNGSSDPDAGDQVVGYSWNFGDGNSSSVAAPNHTYAAGGLYTVTLTVTDTEGATGTRTETVSLALPNQNPVADFSLNCDPNTRICNVDANASYDSDGSITSYAWTFGSGGTGSGVTASYTFPLGSHDINLVVTDDEGATASLTKSVSFVASNTPPTASFNATCDDMTCTISNVSANDSDGFIASYLWSFGDGQTSTSNNPGSHTYSNAGNYDITLTVTDDDNATANHVVNVTASEPNQPPTANFNVACPDLTCSFSNITASDPDGSIVSYEWDFGDGQTHSGQFAPPHTYAVGDMNYTVRLTVRDDDGEETTVTDTVYPTVPLTITISSVNNVSTIKNKNFWNPIATVTVSTSSGTPNNTLISGTFNGNNVSCTTTSSGSCTFTISQTSSSTSSVPLVITTVSHSNYTYNGAALPQTYTITKP